MKSTLQDLIGFGNLSGLIQGTCIKSTLQDLTGFGNLSGLIQQDISIRHMHV